MRLHKKHPRLFILVGLFFVGILIISACSTQQTPEATQELKVAGEQIIERVPTELPAEISPTTEIDIEEDPVNPVDDQGEENTPEPGGYPAPGYQFPTSDTNSGGYPYPSPEQANPPPVKTELQATNPATVNLATGEPQLIEFFAFW
jgi:hypothetical protein